MIKYGKVEINGGLRILRRIIWTPFIVLLALQPSNAQVGYAEDPGDQTISLGVSSDAFAGMELGYSRNPGIAKLKDLQVYARFSLPLLLTIRDRSLDSWEIDLGVNSGLIGSDRLGIIADLRFLLLHHDQVLGTFIPIGIDLSLTPAFRFQKGYVGPQLRWNQIIATHISHSEYVKNTFNGLNTSEKDIQPQDGWYGSTGSYLGFGIEGGRNIGSRSFIHADLGIIQFTSPYTGLVDAMSMGQVPLYLDLRFHYKL